MSALAGATVLAGFINTEVNCVLALLARETWLTDTGVPIHLINTGTTIVTRIDGTIINVDITVRPSPTWFTGALIAEEPVNADAPDTRIAGTQVHLLLTSLTGKSIGTLAGEVMHQICTVATQQAGLFGTVINIDFAESALPAIWTLAGEPTLRQSFAAGPIGAGIAFL